MEPDIPAERASKKGRVISPHDLAVMFSDGARLQVSDYLNGMRCAFHHEPMRLFESCALAVVVLAGAGCPRASQSPDGSVPSGCFLAYTEPGCNASPQQLCGPQDLCAHEVCSCTGKVLDGCFTYREPWTTDLVISPFTGTCVPADAGVIPIMTCSKILECISSATANHVSENFCDVKATPSARNLYSALNQCIYDQCNVGTDGGSSACSTPSACFFCVETGTGQSQSNGPCTATPGGPTIDDPKCGKCVDQLIACVHDR